LIAFRASIIGNALGGGVGSSVGLVPGFTTPPNGELPDEGTPVFGGERLRAPEERGAGLADGAGARAEGALRGLLVRGGGGSFVQNSTCHCSLTFGWRGNRWYSGGSPGCAGSPPLKNVGRRVARYALRVPKIGAGVREVLSERSGC
jgi:hypothetical protein